MVTYNAIVSAASLFPVIFSFFSETTPGIKAEVTDRDIEESASIVEDIKRVNL